MLRPDFLPDSDVDVLVTIAPNVRCSLFKLARMQHELSAILGREADIVERREVETVKTLFAAVCLNQHIDSIQHRESWGVVTT